MHLLHAALRQVLPRWLSASPTKGAKGGGKGGGAAGGGAAGGGKGNGPFELEAALEALIGLDGVKQSLRSLRNR